MLGHLEQRLAVGLERGYHAVACYDAYEPRFRQIRAAETPRACHAKEGMVTLSSQPPESTRHVVGRLTLSPSNDTVDQRSPNPPYVARSAPRVWIAANLTALAIALTACGGPPEACSLAFSEWSGTLVTEAINITLELEVEGLATSDGGNWRFIGAGEQLLNSGPAQSWQSGDMIHVIISEEGALSGSALSGGFVDGCNQIAGTYVVPSGSGGGFNLTRQ